MKIYYLVPFIKYGLSNFILFLLYGLSIAPANYMFSHFFKNMTAAAAITIMLNLILACLAAMVYALNLNPNLCGIVGALDKILMILPGYNFAMGLMRLAMIDTIKTVDLVCEANKGPIDPARYLTSYTSFEWNGVGKYMFAMGIEIAIYWGFTILGEYYFSHPLLRIGVCPDKKIPKTETKKDEDVMNEEKRINEKNPNDKEGKTNLNDILVINNLRKIYNKTIEAVNDLTFGIYPGVCMGLLGRNGSGKTTTLKILSGEILPTEGTAKIFNRDIMTEEKAVRKLIGYCPQTDALFDNLTVSEHLDFYAKIKVKSK